MAGVLIALLKNLIHMAVSQSGFVGELSNFLLGASFSLVAGLIYKHKKTKGEAMIASVAASLVMALISVPFNYFVIPAFLNSSVAIKLIIGHIIAIIIMEIASVITIGRSCGVTMQKANL